MGYYPNYLARTTQPSGSQLNNRNSILDGRYIHMTTRDTRVPIHPKARLFQFSKSSNIKHHHQALPLPHYRSDTHSFEAGDGLPAAVISSYNSLDTPS